MTRYEDPKEFLARHQASMEALYNRRPSRFLERRRAARAAAAAPAQRPQPQPEAPAMPAQKATRLVSLFELEAQP